MNEDTKLTKQALAKVFNPKFISVSHDRGTAASWINVRINLPVPANCTCNWMTQETTWKKASYTYKHRGPLTGDPTSRSTYMCEACLTLYDEALAKANTAVHTSGAKYGTYYADDGYGTAHSEVLMDIKIGGS